MTSEETSKGTELSRKIPTGWPYSFSVECTRKKKKNSREWSSDETSAQPDWHTARPSYYVWIKQGNIEGCNRNVCIRDGEEPMSIISWGSGTLEGEKNVHGAVDDWCGIIAEHSTIDLPVLPFTSMRTVKVVYSCEIQATNYWNCRYELLEGISKIIRLSFRGPAVVLFSKIQPSFQAAPSREKIHDLGTTEARYACEWWRGWCRYQLY